jgi:hypothetical protein
VTGRHSLNARTWVNEPGEPRPPLIRPPCWAVRAWARLDHARYVHRYGHAGPSAGQDWARLHGMATAVADGAVVDGERQTVRPAAGG